MPVTPLPVGEFEVAHVGKGDVAVSRRGQDGAGEGMLAAALKAGGEPQHVWLGQSVGADDRHDFWLAFGQISGALHPAKLTKYRINYGRRGAPKSSSPYKYYITATRFEWATHSSV